MCKKRYWIHYMVDSSQMEMQYTKIQRQNKQLPRIPSLIEYKKFWMYRWDIHTVPYILLHRKNGKRNSKDDLTCYEIKWSNKHMNLHCKIHDDLVHFNKISSAKYLNKLFWFLASRMGKKVNLFSSFKKWKLFVTNWINNLQLK